MHAYLNPKYCKMQIFGSVNLADPLSITIGLLIVIAVLIGFELLFEELKKLALKYNQIEIFSKLKHELMILGIISFCVFMFQSGFSDSPEVIESEYFLAFEVVHVIILFMAFSFITQAFILINFTNKDGKDFLKMVCLFFKCIKVLKALFYLFTVCIY